MGIPSKLKAMNLHIDGDSFIGEVAEVTLPKLSIKTESFRGGGMLGDVEVGMGIDKLEAEFTAGGVIAAALRQFGAASHEAAMLRFTGAYQSDSTSQVKAVEAVMRGRYTEIDWGNAKPGADTEHKHKLSVSYYRLSIDGVEAIFIDLVGGEFRVFGVDRMAEIRAAIGA